jgi:dihydroflavonol-4-reductase
VPYSGNGNVIDMIFVTGAGGHLGSHVLYELVKANRSVRALYRNENKLAFVKKIFSYYQPDQPGLFNNIEWVQGDINDYLSLTEYMKDVSQVYHIAGLVSFDDRDRQKLFLNNAIGTANVVNACLEKSIEKLCHVSSIAALGEFNDRGLINENVIWNQGLSASAYAISKFRAEMEVWRGIYEGLNAVIVNPSVIIGPGMWRGPGKSLFSEIYKGLKYYPSGSSGYVDVRDVARSMIQLTNGNFSGERYIVNAENIKHRTYLNLLADAMERTRPRFRITPILAKIASKAEAIRSSVTGQSPRINIKTLEIASEKLAYSNAKICDTLDMAFIPIEESVQFSVKLFLNDMKSEPLLA